MGWLRLAPAPADTARFTASLHKPSMSMAILTAKLPEGSMQTRRAFGGGSSRDARVSVVLAVLKPGTALCTGWDCCCEPKTKGGSWTSPRARARSCRTRKPWAMLSISLSINVQWSRNRPHFPVIGSRRKLTAQEEKGPYFLSCSPEPGLRRWARRASSLKIAGDPARGLKGKERHLNWSTCSKPSAHRHEGSGASKKIVQPRYAQAQRRKVRERAGAGDTWLRWLKWLRWLDEALRLCTALPCRGCYSYSTIGSDTARWISKA